MQQQPTSEPTKRVMAAWSEYVGLSGDSDFDQYPRDLLDSDDTPAGRYLLVERNVRQDAHYLSVHESMADAGDYHCNQEYREDWDVVDLIDLDTGMRYSPTLTMSFTPDKPEPELPTWKVLYKHTEYRQGFVRAADVATARSIAAVENLEFDEFVDVAPDFEIVRIERMETT